MPHDPNTSGDPVAARPFGRAAQPPAGQGTSLVKLALLIGLLTLLADQVAGIVRLSTTRLELKEARSAQEQPLDQARRIESQLDALASGTAELASQGNPNAAAVVATLQAQGVSIKAPGAAAQ
jgi:hypothetical protein